MVSPDPSAVQRLSTAAQRHQHEVHFVFGRESQRRPAAGRRRQGQHPQIQLSGRPTNEVHHSRLHRHSVVKLGVGAEERAARVLEAQPNRHDGYRGGLGWRIAAVVHASDRKHKTGRIRVSLLNNEATRRARLAAGGCSHHRTLSRRALVSVRCRTSAEHWQNHRLGSSRALLPRNAESGAIGSIGCSGKMK